MWEILHIHWNVGWLLHNRPVSLFLDFAIKVNPSCVHGANNAQKEKSIVWVLPKISLIRSLLNIIFETVFWSWIWVIWVKAQNGPKLYAWWANIDINLVFISNTTFHNNRLINDDDTQAHFYYIVFGILSCYTKHS